MFSGQGPAATLSETSRSKFKVTKLSMFCKPPTPIRGINEFKCLRFTIMIIICDLFVNIPI